MASTMNEIPCPRDPGTEPTLGFHGHHLTTAAFGKSQLCVSVRSSRKEPWTNLIVH